MCKVNFVSEFNMLMRYAKNNGLSARERLLWIALFTIANDRATYNEQTKEYDWPEDFIPVPNGELTLQSTLDKRGIETVRNTLKQRGLIDFIPGMKNKRMPMYKMLYLSVDVGYKTVPNDVPNHVPSYAPNDVPNHVPNDVPNHVPKSSEVGYKNAPNIVPIIPNKEININHDQGRSRADKAKPTVAGHTGEEGWSGSVSDGFVDLHCSPNMDVGFVPLPWEDV